MRLKSYLGGQWVEGDDAVSELFNPTTEELLATTSNGGFDFAEALKHARNVGGPALRAMTFAQRAELLGAVSKAVHEKREELLDIATQNAGNTRGDAKFDIDGATATLSYYAKFGAKLAAEHLLADADTIQLSRSPRLVGRHFYAPRHGVAVFINAFNFPAWGFAEKAATALLAGMPVLTKAAGSTALVAHRMAEVIVDAKILPEGVVSFLFGGAGDLLDHLDWQDVVAFTGSSATGLKIRGHQNVLQKGVRVNVEADSLNAAVLGPDLDRDSDAYDLFLREAVRDMTQKSGQKCTAIRRIFVPQDKLAEVRQDLCDQLAAIKTGDPNLREVTVGPLATAQQLRDVKGELDKLLSVAKAVYGDGGRGALTNIDNEKGYFMSPTLLEAENAEAASPIHSREVFGPVATLMPYSGDADDACALLTAGGGSLVSSVYSDDADFAEKMVRGASASLGRIHLGSSKVAEHSPGPGTVLPMQTHGGPGRAGGGEELGGERGMHFYMQRTAVQGFAPIIEKLK